MTMTKRCRKFNAQRCQGSHKIVGQVIRTQPIGLRAMASFRAGYANLAWI